MTVFDSDAFDGHEAVIFHADPGTGLRAIVAIHSSVLGPAFGGLRMRAYASEAVALDDALRLSKGMTYKAAMADVAFGGGKAVIIGDPRTRKTHTLLRAMGRFVESLNGRYHTADDMGTTVADMDVLRSETRFAHGFAEASGNPPPATAYGVFAGIRAAVAQRLGRDDLEGVGVAIQGLGNVGARLARYLAAAGPGSGLPTSSLRASSARPTSSRLGPSRPRTFTPPAWTSSRPARRARSSTTARCPGSGLRSSPAPPTTSSIGRATAPPSRRGASCMPPTTSSTRAG